MTTNQAYERFIIKINGNATTDNLSCDKGRFVVLFNNQTNRLVEFILEKRFEDDIRYIQKLLVENKKITSSSNHYSHSDFPLPKDFFDHSNLYCLASKDKCKGQKIDCFEVKSEDIDILLQDSNNNPSFKFRETIYHFASDKILIYKEDFSIDSAFLSYYRYPKQISLINEENPEGDFSSVNPEFDDKFINRVIDGCASEFFLNSDDQKFQISKANSVQKP